MELFSIYKSGQGYWTRMLSAIGAAVLLLSGVAWFWTELDSAVTDPRYRATAQVVTTVVAILGGLLIGFYLLNKPRIAEFLIATESEMRKVNWPSRKELVKETWIVICGTFMFVAILFCIDILFTLIFKQIGIIQLT